MGAQHQERSGFFGLELARMSSRPEQARGAQLGDLHEEVHADAEEEAQPRREGVDVEAARRCAARTYSTPSARVKASSCTPVAPASCMW